MKRILMGLGIGSLLLTGWAQAQTYGGSSGSSGSSQSGSSMGGSSAGSAGSTMGGTASSMGTSDTKQIQGRVENFDRSNNTLTVAGSDKALKVDSSTQVLKDGAEASLSDIKEGDQVRASYSGTGDNLHVQRLEVTTSKTGGPSAPSTPSAPSQAPSGSKGGY